MLARPPAAKHLGDWDMRTARISHAYDLNKLRAKFSGKKKKMSINNKFFINL